MTQKILSAALSVILVLVLGFSTLSISVAQQKPETAKIEDKNEIQADQKLSLEWINIRLRETLAREMSARLKKEAAEQDRIAVDLNIEADKKLEEIKVTAKVPKDWVGELTGNQISFKRPVEKDPKKSDSKDSKE